MTKSKSGVILLFAILALCAWSCGQPANTMTTPARPMVSVVHPQRGDLVKSIELPGDVVGIYETALHAKVTGYLKTINVDKGDRVKAGELLAEIEVPELQSNLRRTQASEMIARITYERLKKVQQQDSRLVSQEDVDLAYAKFQEASASVATLESMVKYTTITAPFDGVVTGRFADPGALIRAGGGDFGIDETSGLISPGATEGAGGHRGGGGPILTIADIDKLRIYIYVPERSYPFIHVGTPATLRFDEFPGHTFKGTVARYASSLDLATRTMLTEVDIDNHQRMVYPRSYARVTIDLVRHTDVLTVPNSAIQKSGDVDNVLVVSNGRLTEVPVKTGISSGNSTEITSGLQGQSLVVLSYSNSLPPGTQVSYKLADSVQTAATTTDSPD